MEEKKNIAPIDVAAIFKKLWLHRKTYYKVLPATLILTYLLTLSVPRYYSCTVSLAPEGTTASISGSLGSLASSFGLGSSSKLNSQDAIYAEIYPNVIGSKDFIAELMNVEVETQDKKVKCNYYTYLRDKQKAAWWDIVKGTISGWFSSSPKDPTTGNERLSVFNLTKRQDEIFNSAKGKIKCSYDKKTEIVSITVEDQDPLVCATMANATCKKLQEFIVNYRTNKARIDYEYYKKLVSESKEAYDQARQQYASYADANQNVMLASYKAKQEDLENEMQLKYNIYTAMTTQLQEAQAKLQEAIPAFTVIESASVPIKPAGPKRMFIAIIVMLLTFAGMSFYFLHRQ